MRSALRSPCAARGAATCPYRPLRRGAVADSPETARAPPASPHHAPDVCGAMLTRTPSRCREPLQPAKMNDSEVHVQINQVRLQTTPLPGPSQARPSAPPTAPCLPCLCLPLQMVQFIHQEAKEKANEIKLKTDEEFNIEKLRMVEAEKQKIRAEYERKEKQVEVQKRIAQSNEVRFSRLKALKARDDAMQGVLAEAASKLPSLVSSAGYGNLLESLVLEVRPSSLPLTESCSWRPRTRHELTGAAGLGSCAFAGSHPAGGPEGRCQGRRGPGVCCQEGPHCCRAKVPGMGGQDQGRRLGEDDFH
jgi:hypothetical protein